MGTYFGEIRVGKDYQATIPCYIGGYYDVDLSPLNKSPQNCPILLKNGSSTSYKTCSKSDSELDYNTKSKRKKKDDVVNIDITSNDKNKNETIVNTSFGISGRSLSHNETSSCFIQRNDNINEKVSPTTSQHGTMPITYLASETKKCFLNWPEHQADMVWNPKSISDDSLLAYIKMARNITSLAGVYHKNGMTKLDGQSAISKDQTTQHYFDLLHKNDYNVKKTLKILEGQPTPSLWERDWNHEDAKIFTKAVRNVGKEFHTIRSEYLKDKQTRDLVQFYYFWKKSPYNPSRNQRRPRKVVRRTSVNPNNTKKLNTEKKLSNDNNSNSNLPMTAVSSIPSDLVTSSSQSNSNVNTSKDFSDNTLVPKSSRINGTIYESVNGTKTCKFGDVRRNAARKAIEEMSKDAHYNNLFDNDDIPLVNLVRVAKENGSFRTKTAVANNHKTQNKVSTNGNINGQSVNTTPENNIEIKESICTPNQNETNFTQNDPQISPPNIEPLVDDQHPNIVMKIKLESDSCMSTAIVLTKSEEDIKSLSSPTQQIVKDSTNKLTNDCYDIDYIDKDKNVLQNNGETQISNTPNKSFVMVSGDSMATKTEHSSYGSNKRLKLNNGIDEDTITKSPTLTNNVTCSNSNEEEALLSCPLFSAKDISLNKFDSPTSGPYMDETTNDDSLINNNNNSSTLADNKSCVVSMSPTNDIIGQALTNLAAATAQIQDAQFALIKTPPLTPNKNDMEFSPQISLHSTPIIQKHLEKGIIIKDSVLLPQACDEPTDDKECIDTVALQDNLLKSTLARRHKFGRFAKAKIEKAIDGESCSRCDIIFLLNSVLYQKILIEQRNEIPPLTTQQNDAKNTGINHIHMTNHAVMTQNEISNYSNPVLHTSFSSNPFGLSQQHHYAFTNKQHLEEMSNNQTPNLDANMQRFPIPPMFPSLPPWLVGSQQIEAKDLIPPMMLPCFPPNMTFEDLFRMFPPPPLNPFASAGPLFNYLGEHSSTDSHDFHQHQQLIPGDLQGMLAAASINPFGLMPGFPSFLPNAPPLPGMFPFVPPFMMDDGLANYDRDEPSPYKISREKTTQSNDSKNNESTRCYGNGERMPNMSFQRNESVDGAKKRDASQFKQESVKRTIPVNKDNLNNSKNHQNLCDNSTSSSIQWLPNHYNGTELSKNSNRYTMTGEHLAYTSNNRSSGPLKAPIFLIPSVSTEPTPKYAYGNSKESASIKYQHNPKHRFESVIKSPYGHITNNNNGYTNDFHTSSNLVTSLTVNPNFIHPNFLNHQISTKLKGTNNLVREQNYPNLSSLSNRNEPLSILNPNANNFKDFTQHYYRSPEDHVSQKMPQSQNMQFLSLSSSSPYGVNLIRNEHVNATNKSFAAIKNDLQHQSASKQQRRRCDASSSNLSNIMSGSEYRDHTSLANAAKAQELSQNMSFFPFGPMMDHSSHLVCYHPSRIMTQINNVNNNGTISSTMALSSSSSNRLHSNLELFNTCKISTCNNITPPQQLFGGPPPFNGLYMPPFPLVPPMFSSSLPFPSYHFTTQGGEMCLNNFTSLNHFSGRKQANNKTTNQSPNNEKTALTNNNVVIVS